MRTKGNYIMKSTGITRHVDELGRIVLPIELRRAFHIDIKDALEIYTEDDKIILKKLQRSCVFCKSSEDIVEFGGKAICPDCLAKLKNLG